MIVLVPTSYEWFEQWREEPKGKRSSDYEALKTSFVEASVLAVMKLFPQLEGKVGRACGYGDRTLGAISPFSLWQENNTLTELSSREGRELMQAISSLKENRRGRDEELRVSLPPCGCLFSP